VDDYFHTGLLDGKEQNALPFPVSASVLARGQERFNIYCTPCHSRVGNGEGMIVQRGYKPAGNFHDAKRLAEPLSHYFYVMTNGYGAMPDYSAQLPPEDRWAVAAYIRVLQLSQNATAADVPSGAKVDSLADIAVSEGYDAGFAGAWPMPIETNVQAIQPGQAPAVSAPAQPATPKVQSHPTTKPPEGDAGGKPPTPNGGN
jgi:mono/diheme cytochrome c family protein